MVEERTADCAMATRDNVALASSRNFRQTSLDFRSTSPSKAIDPAKQNSMAMERSSRSTLYFSAAGISYGTLAKMEWMAEHTEYTSSRKSGALIWASRPSSSIFKTSAGNVEDDVPLAPLAAPLAFFTLLSAVGPPNRFLAFGFSNSSAFMACWHMMLAVMSVPSSLMSPGRFELSRYGTRRPRVSASQALPRGTANFKTLKNTAFQEPAPDQGLVVLLNDQGHLMHVQNDRLVR
mmetsp:Transcript_87246/g.182597  ORF Transcript_87246/g.182597 Transcript_87246/m.182597 type:complete len:235 (+) Transcript_87246:1127-1831(+)